MRLLDTEQRKAVLLFKKSVDDFVMMEGIGNPDWHGDLRCEWTDFSVEVSRTPDEWLMTIDGARLVWCNPLDLSDAGAAVIWMTWRMCQFLKADATAKRLLGP